MANQLSHLLVAKSRPSLGAVPTASILAPPLCHALRLFLAPYCGQAGRAATLLTGSGEDSHPLLLRFSAACPLVPLLRSDLRAGMEKACSRYQRTGPPGGAFRVLGWVGQACPACGRTGKACWSVLC